MEDVLQIIHPDQGSHFRLRACEADGCGGAAVYVKYRHPGGGERWRVACTACGATVDIETTVQHDAQVEWNRRNNRAEIDRENRHHGSVHRKAHAAARPGGRQHHEGGRPA